MPSFFWLRVSLAAHQDDEDRAHAQMYESTSYTKYRYTVERMEYRLLQEQVRDLQAARGTIYRHRLRVRRTHIDPSNTDAWIG